MRQGGGMCAVMFQRRWWRVRRRKWLEQMRARYTRTRTSERFCSPRRNSIAHVPAREREMRQPAQQGGGALGCETLVCSYSISPSYAGGVKDCEGLHRTVFGFSRGPAPVKAECVST